jgi:hypothetical protein
VVRQAEQNCLPYFYIQLHFYLCISKNCCIFVADFDYEQESTGDIGIADGY